jgi:hypothetical protein
MSEFIRLFWKLRYALYSRDLYRGLRAGRGSKDNPLRMDDLKPLMKALARIENPSKPPNSEHPVGRTAQDDQTK